MVTTISALKESNGYLSVNTEIEMSTTSFTRSFSVPTTSNLKQSNKIVPNNMVAAVKVDVHFSSN